MNRDDRWVSVIIWAPFLVAIAVLSWTIACGQNSANGPSAFSTVEPEGNFITGVTSSLSVDTAPPPPPPPPPPRGELNSGILLAYDHPCPTCTLVTPRGAALVWLNTAVFAETQDGEVPISFDELNEALQPGQPFKIRVDNLNATQPVAQVLTVQRRFATTGTIDRSSDDVLATGEFMLTVFDETTGRIDISYVLAADPVVEAFEATDRVFLSGVSRNGTLRTRLVRPDE